MSDEDIHLLQAKQALGRGDMGTAISILLDAMKYDAKKAAAAYSLGIVYDMRGTCHNIDLAMKYYSISEYLGSDLATYRIGGIQHRTGKAAEALETFKKISDKSPSAAYWCYRLTKEMNPSNPEVEVFLDKAASLGHVLAKRDILLEGLKGKNGVRHIFTSAFSMVGLFLEVKSAVAKKDEMLYQ
ncbi:hypothetical protein NKH16_07075 [Mesorhizobium sp. M1307]|uniref:tetratricopeptide repeat protein n=1 Tax=Mesorhizobium sp. M1307 TaxID=2957079 RepID=UPI00333BA23D